MELTDSSSPRGGGGGGGGIDGNTGDASVIAVRSPFSKRLAFSHFMHLCFVVE